MEHVHPAAIHRVGVVDVHVQAQVRVLHDLQHLRGDAQLGAPARRLLLRRLCRWQAGFRARGVQLRVEIEREPPQARVLSKRLLDGHEPLGRLHERRGVLGRHGEPAPDHRREQGAAAAAVPFGGRFAPQSLGVVLVHVGLREGEHGLGDVLSQRPVALELRLGVELVPG